MYGDQQFSFGAFRFDGRTGQLWRERRELKLTPRAAEVLHVLAECAPDLVTKKELFERVWRGMAVSDDALTSCIRELRQTLGDRSWRPRYIETKHRRGYRLMMPARRASRAAATASTPPRLIGRAEEIRLLHRCSAEAEAERRQLVFITGEAGIGKTSLLGAFLATIRGGAKVAHGQCLDHHGVSEPYLPLIEALTRLAGASRGAAVKTILAKQAPSWLAQMPSLWSRAERAAMAVRTRASPERMMRELTLALEAIAVGGLLVLVLEDLHWSDASTLDWLSHVARRPESAPLLVIATFRPAEATAQPGLRNLVTELSLHGLCCEIPLRPLGRAEIERYLEMRLGEGVEALHLREMAALLAERTGGNPLFVSSIASEMAHRDPRCLAPEDWREIPKDVRRFIAGQIDGLSEEEFSLLTAASVVGREFTSTAVAAALELAPDTVETDCARLARQAVFLANAGATTWPDGSRAELYAFRHDLYRELLYERLSQTRRMLFHARTGRRLEAAWASAPELIASELAEHFERGNEPARAIPHHQRAAATAMRRSANSLALGHLHRALASIGNVTDTRERQRIEAALHIGLGAGLIATRGFGAPEVLEAYVRAEQLCQELGGRAETFPALWGQWMYRWGRSEVVEAWQLCERLLAMAESSDDPALKLQAHHAAWATSFGRGRLADTLSHADAGLALYDARTHQAMASSYGNHDAGACARYFSGLALAFAGRPRQSRAMADSAIVAARSLGDPFSLALALFFAAASAQVRGELARAGTHAEASRQLAFENDLAMPKAWSTGVLGWCKVKTGDVEQGLTLLGDAIAALEATHSRHFLGYLFGLAAEARIAAGLFDAARQAIDDGIASVEGNGERFYRAELYRLRGELLARMPNADKGELEQCFRSAREFAEDQGSKELIGRVNDSLRRLDNVRR
jgi:DNA-binding winged helix-turn-helix (wHTH) protein/tetratricopeptide (TPR) repeat protein